MKKALRITLKTLLWIIGSVLFLIILVLVLIQIPGVQNFAKDKAVAFLQNKIKTRVEIADLSIKFPKQIVLKGVFLEDQKKDTLLAAGELRVDIAMLAFLHNTVELSYLELDNFKTHIYRVNPDTSFNFQYIVDAFASGEKDTTTSTDTSSMQFKMGDIVLHNIEAKFKDDESGNDVFFRMNDFKTRIKEFDPSKSIFSIPEINISGIRSSVYQYKPLIEPKPMAVVEAESNEPNTTKLDLKNINIRNVAFDYKNDVSALQASLRLGELLTQFKQLDLSKLFIDLDEIQLNNTNIAVTLGKSQRAEVTKEEVSKNVEAQVNNPWKVQLASLKLNNNALNYDDNTAPKAASGMDFSHIGITGFTVDVGNLALTPTEYKGDLNNLAFKEKSGFGLQKLSTSFLYNDKQAYAKNLSLKTLYSQLNSNVEASYPSIDSITKNPNAVTIDLDINNTSLAAKDILLLAPQLKENLKGHENTKLQLLAKAKGTLGSLNIPAFKLTGYGSTAVALNGYIKGLPDAQKAYYDVKLTQLNTTKTDIVSLAPKDAIPSTVQLPQRINATGSFKGTMNDFNGALVANTERGKANITASMKGKTAYNIKTVLDNVDVGYFTKQSPVIGKVSLTATAKGKGFDYKTMAANINANIGLAQYKGYDYKGLNLTADLSNGTAVIKSDMSDPNINYNLDATADLKPKYPALQMKLALNNLDMGALHLIEDTLTMHAMLDADFASTNPDSLQGTLSVSDIKVLTDTTSISTDSITLTAQHKAGIETINFNSEPVTAQMKGEYKLTQTGTEIMQLIKRYYNIPVSNKDSAALTPQNWQLDMQVRPASALVLQFVPDLKGSDTVGAKIVFNSSANDLNVRIASPLIVYGAQRIEQLNVTANTDADKLNYGIHVDKAGTKSFQLYKSTIDGNMANNKLFTDIVLKDKNNANNYRIAGNLELLDSAAYKFSLVPDSLLLNKTVWSVSNDNYIQYDTSGIIAHNFSISNSGQSLTINSQQPSPSAPLDVSFKDFRIKTLTNFAQQDSLLADGIINGTATLTNPTKELVFVSDLAISDLSYKTDTIGNVSIKVNNQTANAYTADVRVQGKGNDLSVTGNYYTGESRMDLKLNLANLNLETIPALTSGALTEAGGSLKGNLDIQGTVQQPQVNGFFNFENAFVTPSMLGERFKLTNEKINVSNKGINFDHFTLVDSAGHQAVINGDVLTTDFKNYTFALDFNADDFTVVSSTAKENQMFYGKMNIDAGVKIRGTMDAPSINANLRVNKATDFVFVLPSSDPELISREGVVNYVNSADPNDSLRRMVDSATTYKSLAGMDVSANIETDSAAKFTLVIDQRNGDQVELKGQADLNGGIDESGKLSLTGNYEVNSGSYQTTLSVLKRKFELQQGSTILWTGDPMSANLDLTAVYRLKTAPIDLMEQDNSGEDLTTYKQKIPVEVYLKIGGEITKPIITFDIGLSDQTASQYPRVEDKIQELRTNESEMNKQVFALLLLNRFVQENPLETAGGTSTETMVKQSVSSFISDQLNNLTSGLVPGVDLNVGINSEDDYTTGQRASKTDLTVGASKSLLNDRIRVNVGSNFQLEGPSNSNASTSNIAGDVSVDYKLTDDGRYMVRAYRTNQYEGVVEGQVVETGLTFIFKLDYDRFKELFEKKKKDKKKNK